MNRMIGRILLLISCIIWPSLCSSNVLYILYVAVMWFSQQTVRHSYRSLMWFLLLFTWYFCSSDAINVSLMWSAHVLKSFFICCFYFSIKERLIWNSFLCRVWDFSEGLQHWREQPFHIRRGGTTVFYGRLTKVICPWSHFIIWLLFCQEDWDHLPAHWKTQLRSVFVTQTHALLTSLYWRKTSQARPDENKHALHPSTFSVGKMSWNQS